MFKMKPFVALLLKTARSSVITGCVHDTTGTLHKLLFLQGP